MIEFEIKLKEKHGWIYQNLNHRKLSGLEDLSDELGKIIIRFSLKIKLNFLYNSFLKLYEKVLSFVLKFKIYHYYKKCKKILKKNKIM